MKGAVTRNSGRPGTERKFDTITSTEGLRTAPLGARSSGTAAYSPDEVQAARLYAMSKIDAYAPWAPICQHQTPEACARARAEAYLQSYSSAASSAGRKAAVYAHAKTLTSCVDEIHYTIIRSKGMSFEFGDCQYLDQCPRMNAGCRKVHYVKVLPKVGPAVIGVQFLKLTKFKNDPESFDILSSALKEHELRKLVASQKIWAASGRKIPDVVGQEAEVSRFRCWLRSMATRCSS